MRRHSRSKGKTTIAAHRRPHPALSQGLALRYGSFYGPGTSLSDHGAITERVRRRQFPVVGDGTAVWSFLHIDDAAAATLAAVERGAPGLYNVVDDEPAALSTWLPELARALGAPPPRHLPTGLGRLLLGEAGLLFMTQIRGASNAKAKRELGWRPSTRAGGMASGGDSVIGHRRRWEAKRASAPHRGSWRRDRRGRTGQNMPCWFGESSGTAWARSHSR